MICKHKKIHLSQGDEPVLFTNDTENKQNGKPKAQATTHTEFLTIKYY